MELGLETKYLSLDFVLLTTLLYGLVCELVGEKDLGFFSPAPLTSELGILHPLQITMFQEGLSRREVGHGVLKTPKK